MIANPYIARISSAPLFALFRITNHLGDSVDLTGAVGEVAVVPSKPEEADYTAATISASTTDRRGKTFNVIERPMVPSSLAEGTYQVFVRITLVSSAVYVVHAGTVEVY